MQAACVVLNLLVTIPVTVEKGQISFNNVWDISHSFFIQTWDISHSFFILFEIYVLYNYTTSWTSHILGVQ